MSRTRTASKLDSDDPGLAPPSRLLLALEGRALLEWAATTVSWRWLSRRVPRGDGHPVLVLPGLIAGDASTWPLRRFLEASGYAAHPWRQGINIGPREGVEDRLLARIDQLSASHGRRKVSLIGWSLGGAMARALAVRRPEQVRSVITLGSPLSGHPRASNARRIFEMVSGLSADDPELLQRMAEHPPVPMTSILSKSDGVVHWRMSLAPNSTRAENIVVPGSHLGLGVNPIVLWAIADRLAQPEGEWFPLERNGWRGVFYSEQFSGLRPR